MNTLPAKFLKAKHIRVKRTAWNNRHGVSCSNQWEPRNNKVWPGEIGLLTVKAIGGVDWTQSILVAEFEHGREIVVGELPLNQADGQWECGHRFDPQDFLPHKMKAKASS